MKTVVFLNIEYEHGQNDFGILKMLSVRCAAKKWIDEVTKSRVLNKAQL